MGGQVTEVSFARFLQPVLWNNIKEESTMTTIIAYTIVAAVFVAHIAICYNVGKAAGRFIDWIMEAIRKSFH